MMDNSHKIAVIGGAGFIGSHLVNLLTSEGKQAYLYDNFSSGKHSFLNADDKLHITKGDILNQDELTRFIDAVQPDLVYHLAAIHYIPQCEENPSEAIRINIEGTQNVLSACANRVSRLIFTSTGAIYSPDIETELSEESLIDTRDVYGMTKYSGEKLVEHYMRKGRGEAIIVRLFNAVGLNETNPHLIPAILEQLEEGKVKVELGNLYPKRDYIHVQDIADGLYALGSISELPEKRIFNLGSGTERSIQELMDYFKEETALPLEIIQVASRMRKNDRKSQLADNSYLREVTDWSPRRDVKQAIAEIWAELQEKKTVNS
jgi:UDP-glucose 4-epimerase